MKPMSFIGYNQKTSIGITSAQLNNSAISMMIPSPNGLTSASELSDPIKKAQIKSATT
jgi:hypothetical protein